MTIIEDDIIDLVNGTEEEEMQTSRVIMYPKVVVKEEKVIQKEVHLGPNFRKKKKKLSINFSRVSLRLRK